MEQNRARKGLHPAFYVLVTVFFFWGFVAASNGVVIPFSKTHFELTQLESQLIDFAFYGAYFIGSLILYLYSSWRGKDILNKIGYRKGIVIGLLISAVGALLLIGAVNLGLEMENKTFAFYLILGAFFIVALGFSLQQVAANPFAVAMGDPETGANRLSLADGVNSFGTAIGPLVVSILLFGTAAEVGGAMEIEPDITGINTLYFLLTVLFVLVALLFWFAKMPEVTEETQHEHTPHASKSMLAITGFFVLIVLGIVVRHELPFFIIGLLGIIAVLFYSNHRAKKNSVGWGAMQYPQLVLGMFSLLIYVGTEVTIQSNLGSLLEKPGFINADGLDGSQIDPYISLFWGGLMIGRWAGAITAFDIKKTTRKILLTVVPVVAYLVVLLINYLKGNAVLDLLPFVPFLVLQIIGFYWGQEKPAKTVLIFGILGAAMMALGIFTTGYIATFAFVSGGLFCSVMFPNIFALSITGLKKHTGEGSTFLIMMILGGALIPPIQGGLADIDFIGAHYSYIVPLITFLILGSFGYYAKRILKAQGFNYD